MLQDWSAKGGSRLVAGFHAVQLEVRYAAKAGAHERQLQGVQFDPSSKRCVSFVILPKKEI